MAKPFKVKRPDSEFIGVLASSLATLKNEGLKKLKFPEGTKDQQIEVHEEDGTIVDAEDYFATLASHTKFVLAVPGENYKAPPTASISTSLSRAKIKDIGPVIDCTSPGMFVDINYLEEAGLGTAGRFYVRDEWTRLWEQINTYQQNHKNIFFDGPPGTGKSTLVWAWCLWYASKGNYLRWIHADDGGFNVVDFNGTKQMEVYDNLTGEQLKSNSPNVNTKITIFDGVSKNATSIFRDVVPVWYSHDKSRRFIGVSSVQFGWKVETLQKYNVESINSTGWTLEDYKQACSDSSFYNQVKINLDADKNAMTLEDQLDAKYYYAGACARWMFSVNTAKAIQDIHLHISKIGSTEDLMKGIVGNRSNVSVNHVFTTIDGDNCFFVSNYVTLKIAKKATFAFIAEATRISATIKNGSFDGWVFQMDFLYRIQKAGLTLSKKITFANSTEVWEVANFYEYYDLLDIGAFAGSLVDGSWLIPTKVNQGCYDAAQYFRKSGDLRIVQLTVAKKHGLKLKFVVELITYLKNLSLPVHRIEIAFVIPNGNTFQPAAIDNDVFYRELLKYQWDVTKLRVLELVRADSQHFENI